MDLSPTSDGGIIKTIIEEDSNGKCPLENYEVTVHLILSYEGKAFLDSETTFDLGFGSEFSLPPGIDIVVRSMHRGDKCSVVLSSEYAYGETGLTSAHIPPSAPGSLFCQVHLLEFKKPKAFWDMNEDQKIEFSEKMKRRGNRMVEVKDWKKAYRCYRSVIKTLEGSVSVKENRSAVARELLISASSNIALCLLKLEKFQICVDVCTKCLSLEPNHPKVLYRLGKAYFSLGDFERAHLYFSRGRKLDPESRLFTHELVECSRHLKVTAEKEKGIYKNIFDKMEKADDKNDLSYRFGSFPVEDWSNDMANEMMSLHEELEAFGETMPEPKMSRIRPAKAQPLDDIVDEDEEEDD